MSIPMVDQERAKGFKKCKKCQWSEGSPFPHREGVGLVAELESSLRGIVFVRLVGHILKTKNHEEQNTNEIDVAFAPSSFSRPPVVFIM